MPLTLEMSVLLRKRLNALQREIHHSMIETRAQLSVERCVQPEPNGLPDNDLAIVNVNTHSTVLRSIDDALNRLDAGTYGSCVDCLERIAVKRLLAMPFVTHCRSCQEEFERHRTRAYKTPRTFIDTRFTSLPE